MITFLLMGLLTQVTDNILIKDIPVELRMKAPSEDIVASKVYDVNTKPTILYAYKGNKLERTPNEVSRTENGFTIKLSDNKFETTIFSGFPQFYDDIDGWKQLEYATTTPEVYKAKVNFLDQFRAYAASDTFFPDANSVDGYVGYKTGAYGGGTGVAWATIQPAAAAPDTSYLSYTSTQMNAGIEAETTGHNNKWRILSRIFLTFDTSSLPDTDNIDSATLSIVKESETGALGGTQSINIFSSAPTNDTSLVPQDYGNVGSTAFSTAKNEGVCSAENYCGFVLNASRLSVISKTGISKFSIREATNDASNSEPSWASEAYYFFNMYSSESAGINSDPKIVIVHSAGGEPPAPPAETSTTTTTIIFGLTAQEFLFLACVGLFFISYRTWGLMLPFKV